MSAPAQKKIFGISFGVDPKVLVGALIALAVFLFWFNSRGDDAPSTPSSTSRLQSGAANAIRPAKHAIVSRRASTSSDRDVLKVREIDPTRGDIDPTLRLGLLARLQTADLKPATRNLFEPGQPVQMAGAEKIKGPIIQPKPLPPPVTPSSTTPPPLQANIPLKYYGFARPVSRAEANRGFFLDGDNVLVASEGETVMNRYLIVQLTPERAKIEDTQVKLGQTLPVVAEAVEQ